MDGQEGMKDGKKEGAEEHTSPRVYIIGASFFSELPGKNIQMPQREITLSLCA